MASDNHARSAAKANSWRIPGTVDSMLISWLITCEFRFARRIDIVQLITMTLLHRGQGRFWNRMLFGRRKFRDNHAI